MKRYHLKHYNFDYTYIDKKKKKVIEIKIGLSIIDQSMYITSKLDRILINIIF